jgi:hypothetical protein
MRRRLVHLLRLRHDHRVLQPMFHRLADRCKEDQDEYFTRRHDHISAVWLSVIKSEIDSAGGATPAACARYCLLHAAILVLGSAGWAAWLVLWLPDAVWLGVRRTWIGKRASYATVARGLRRKLAAGWPRTYAKRRTVPCLYSKRKNLCEMRVS